MWKKKRFIILALSTTMLLFSSNKGKWEKK